METIRAKARQDKPRAKNAHLSMYCHRFPKRLGKNGGER